MLRFVIPGSRQIKSGDDNDRGGPILPPVGSSPAMTLKIDTFPTAPWLILKSLSIFRRSA
jgi:hypothetical protein